MEQLKEAIKREQSQTCLNFAECELAGPKVKHECGVALIRLLKPLSYYERKYGTWRYGLNKLYLMMEKQHNRGQEGAGVACVNLDAPAGEEYMFRE